MENTPAPHIDIGDFEDPKRLHPFSMAMTFLKLTGNLVPAYAAIYVAAAKKPEIFVFALGGILLLFFGILVAQYLKWRAFSYEVSDEGVLISSGILSRKHRSISYERIQDVNLERNILARIFGLCVLKLETGSGDGADGTLNSVSVAEAEAIRDHIRLRKKALHTGHEAGDIHVTTAINMAKTRDAHAQSGENTDIVTLFTMNNKRLLIAGFFNMSLVIFAIIGAALQNVDMLFSDTIFSPEYWIDRYAPGVNWDPKYWAAETMGYGEQFLAYNVLIAIIATILSILALLVIAIISGIIRSFLTNFGFLLETHEKGFRRQRGLFTTTDMVMPVRRIQAAKISYTPLMHVFKWWELRFVSLASDGKNTNHEAAPLAKKSEIEPILGEPEILWDMEKEQLGKISHIYPWVNGLAGFAGLLLGTIILYQFFSEWALIASILLILPIIAAYVSWRQFGYAIDLHAMAHGQLYIHHGFWKRHWDILPLHKIQSVTIAVNPITRFFGLADVRIGVAGDKIIAPCHYLDKTR